MSAQSPTEPRVVDSLVARWRTRIEEAGRYRGKDEVQQLLIVDTDRQTLLAFDAARLHAGYPVSTSRFGLGCRENSHQTPTGWHRIAEKIGAGCDAGEVFIGRQPQGWLAQSLNEEERGARDWITSRILWLRGLQPGWNLGAGCDSHDRYIYIHGTAAKDSIGRPASIGCVRMRDADVIALFDWVQAGTPVFISGEPGRDSPGGGRTGGDRN